MQPGKTYHVYNHGNADDNLFRSDENYRYFLQKYSEYIHPIVNTFAYCLLPNHFHFLMTVKEEIFFTNISDDPENPSHLPGFENLTGVNLEKRIVKQFSNFFNGYTKAFNNMFERRGKLFLLPFQRKPITNSWQFLNTLKYIHFNPVHHHFCRDPFDWTHSSVHDYRLKDSRWISLSQAQKKSEANINVSEIRDFRPDSSDFLEFNY